MLSAQAAASLILDLVQPLCPDQHTERIPLESAVGRILASTLSSSLDFPHWDNSAMDGYAVRHGDVATCSEAHPAILEIVEEIPAGRVPQKRVQPGQAARILTGSMMPEGTDTIVMQEVTRREGNQVSILAAPAPEAFVRHRAEYYQAGTPLLPAGIRLSATEIAVLAAAQVTAIPVYRRPRVAILSTGSELVSPDQPLQPGQIVDSNQYALAALVAQSGAEPIRLGIVPDQPAVLKETIAHALNSADLILSSGGVSVGDYDYVEEILESFGATLHIQSVAVKPGKPLTVASFSAPPTRPIYFGLPGNPASALVTFWRFVQPALRKLSGLGEGWEPSWVKGTSLVELRGDSRRETYVWGNLRLVEGEYGFVPAKGSHSSGNLINLAQTDSLAMIPVGRSQIQPGESVQVLNLSL